MTEFAQDIESFQEENQDSCLPLPDIKNRRRSSCFVDDYNNPSSLPVRIMRHWAPIETIEDEEGNSQQKSGHQVHFRDDFDGLINRSGTGGLSSMMNFAVPKFAMPRRISIDEMTNILSDCISDTAGRRESMGGQMTIPDNVTGEQRKASVVVRRPSMAEIHENACRISSAIDDIIAERYKAQLESEGAFDQEMDPQDIPLITTEAIAEALDSKLPDIDIMDMDEDIIVDEYVEPTEEMTVEDASDMWAGTLDTTLPPNTAGIPQERPIAKQVSEAISDLTDTLASVETDISQKLAALCAENPVLQNATADIQSDLSEFVSRLAEKLADKNEFLEQEAQNEITQKAESVKAQFLKEEQDRLDQLRQEQAMLKAQKDEEDRRFQIEMAAAQAAEQAVQPEDVSSEDELPQVPKPLSIPEPIMEHTEVTEVEAAPTDKKSRKDKKEKREKKKKKKSKEGETTDKKGKKDVKDRRRKTSSGRKLELLRTQDAGLGIFDGPEQTPAPEKQISVDDFMKSAGLGRPKAVIKYIMDGGDVNSQDDYKRTALQKACLYGEGEIIDLLLAKKAKCNLSDRLGDTALHWAARGGNPEVVSKIVKAGGKLNAKDKLFSSPLHVGVRCGVQEVVEKLIELGANINAKDREGDTPMHDAVRLGRFKLIKTLLAAGANLRAKNMHGKTPIDMVQLWYEETKSHHAEIILQALSTAPPKKEKVVPDGR